MDLPRVFEEPEEIKPKIIELEDSEADCPLCGGSGPCYVCERGKLLALKWKRRQDEISHPRNQIPRRKKAV